ncbi:beta-lactamase class D [Azospirillum lipoferum]|nr:class D beta-lactamase [Azospirillum agricola]SMH56321.1 beta-lactamase class D [Azospirillum lipoferum]
MIDRRQLTKGICIGLGMGALGAPLGALAAEATRKSAKAVDRIVCSVVLDAASGAVLFREGPCGTRFSPASTFKVPLALMGYDSGILEDEHRPVWDYRPEFNATDREKKTTDPTIWERDSIVWYSQEITRRLGMKRFQGYIDRFDYGNRDLTGDPARKDGLTRSWLMSSLAVSPDEQARLLKRLLDGALPVSERAQRMTMAILPQFAAADGWAVRGKTGSGWLRNASGVKDPTLQLGWFVGWAEREGQRVVFARLESGAIQSDKFAGLVVREALLAGLPGMIAR